MILPITLTLAGAAAVINIWLGWRVGQKRISQKVSIGDGGDPAVVCRMRAHANFVEYTPFVLILIGLIELADGVSLDEITAKTEARFTVALEEKAA